LETSSSMDDDSIVIDNGSFKVKSGYLGEQAPRASFLNVVGRPKVKEVGMADSYVAEFAKLERDSMCYPVERGIIQNWDDMETVWYHNYYNELREDPTEHAIVITEAISTPQSQRERTATIFFETHEAPNISFVNQTLCTCLNSSSTTALVVELGHGCSQIANIVDGKVTNGKKLNVGGIDVSQMSDDEKVNFYVNNSVISSILDSCAGVDTVVIGGGMSGVSALFERIKGEIKSANGNIVVSIGNADRPERSVYGGLNQALELLPLFSSNLVSKDYYEEAGPSSLSKFNI